MLTDMQAGRAWANLQDASSQRQEAAHETPALPQELKWRVLARSAGSVFEDIAISRWTDEQNNIRHAEATTPADRYFIAIALKTTRLKLIRERQIIFDGIMPVGTIYVSAPGKRIAAQFHAPCDFLHFHVSADYFPSQPGEPLADTEGLDDLVHLRDPFAEQLARALTEHRNAADLKFARCIGQTLAMHLARLEFPRTKVNALPKWRLRRVEEHVKAHFDHCISLSDLAKVAGLSRMHFAAQFRAATGYRPREYLLHQRIEHAKSLLSNGETPLAEIALAVGFCTQAHFSTVFKRMTGETPARWRCASKNEAPALLADVCEAGASRSCELRSSMASRNTATARFAMLQM
jgi:AraC family transcriptional regulator